MFFPPINEDASLTGGEKTCYPAPILIITGPPGPANSCLSSESSRSLTHPAKAENPGRVQQR
jgi:hypothetical protein